MKKLNKLQQLSFIIRREYWAISTSYAVLLVLMGGIFVYGLLYNYMYAPNIVTDVPVAVVDNSHSELSRNFIRWLDATPQAEIYDQAMDYHEAKEWMKAGKVQGILYLPHDFEERVFRGDEAVFSLYATTDAFFYFEAYQGALHVWCWLSMTNIVRTEQSFASSGIIGGSYGKACKCSGNCTL